MSPNSEFDIVLKNVLFFILNAAALIENQENDKSFGLIFQKRDLDQLIRRNNETSITHYKHLKKQKT